jgi:hypothetical protein
MAVVRSDDISVDWPWGTARLKFDRVAILGVPKSVSIRFYFSVKATSISRPKRSAAVVAGERCGGYPLVENGRLKREQHANCPAMRGLHPSFLPALSVALHDLRVPDPDRV